ncbi:sugar kinase [Alicyclobacillaceae bacterium I2511]|nr:sugar kinase [Alicyclobacillaceae bacterium I2511]
MKGVGFSKVGDGHTDVVTFGESMVVLAPQTAGSLDTVTDFHRGMAGAEGNVAVALARLGHRVQWLSRLGDDGFGRFIYKTLRGEGVNVAGVHINPERPTGVYFKEYLPTGRVRVQYYRSGSAAAGLEPKDVNLAHHQARFLFITGITPALSDTCLRTVQQAIQDAHELGMTVVFDPNVRYKLWPSAERAREVLRELAGQAEIVLPGLEEGQLLTGKRDAETLALDLLQNRTQLVVVKLGPSGAYYHTPEQSGHVAGFSVTQVDEVGAGDAFAAGVLSGLIDNLPIPEVVRRACALGAMAVTSSGDYEGLPDRRALLEFMDGRAAPLR